MLNIRRSLISLFTLFLVLPFFPADGQLANAGEPVGIAEVKEDMAEVLRSFKKDLQALPQATGPDTSAIDTVIAEVKAALEFSAGALDAGKIDVAADALTAARGMANIASNMVTKSVRRAKKPVSEAGSQEQPAGAEPVVGMTYYDMDNVEQYIGHMSREKIAEVDDIEHVMSRLERAGFNVMSVESSLRSSGFRIEDVAANFSTDLAALRSLSGSIDQILRDQNLAGDISDKWQDLFYQIGDELQVIVDAISTALNDETLSKLDEMAKDIGFSDFSSFVDAVNSTYGTDFTEQELRDALGLN